MSDPRGFTETDEILPRAKIKVRRRKVSAVWIVPIVAAVVAGYVAYDRFREFGPKITISFKDASGLTAGQTEIKYRGVPLGEVTAIELSADQSHAEVKVRLKRSAAPIAREGSLFWIVRPEVGIGNITGLRTVLSGPEIQLLPGNGRPKEQFVGLDSAPPALDRKGLNIVLRSSHPGLLRSNAPVYYRGVEVGVVQSSQLSPNATSADIHVYIMQRYANLVRTDSVFWNASGLSVDAGLFRGLEIKVESLRSLQAGGIAISTPGNTHAARAKDGSVFPLHSEAKAEWLAWAPQIPIPAEK